MGDSGRFRRAGALRRVPSAVVELLRFWVVLFFAALGYQVGTLVAAQVDAGGERLLGPFDAVWIGLILGSALGYVLGGLLGRGTITVMSRTERLLRTTSAEQVLAGAFGAFLGVVGATVVAWPLFLLGSRSLVLPVFGFFVVALSLLGYRLGAERRNGLLRTVGPRLGLAVKDAAATLPRLIDSSVAIDGRVLDVVRAGFLSGRFLVSVAVLDELQGLADAGDETRRGRGRRGLEVLEALRNDRSVDIEVVEDRVPGVPEVDAVLVRLALDLPAALLTLDTNLAKVAAVAGVRVMNLHALALALRPPVVAGDEVSVLLIKAGKEPGQAIGYLDDGTMVVVERARDTIGSETQVHVTSVLTTANGRMVFARPLAAGAVPAPAVLGAVPRAPHPRDPGRTGPSSRR